MHREYHKWYSPRLNRDMELNVYGHAGARVLVFPTSMGRFHEYEDRGMVANLTDQLENGSLQLYCVDSVDGESFYNGWAHPSGRIVRHIQYEEYILNEVLPLTRARNGNPFLMTHGCSFGAYHAVNIAFRHPHLFGRVLALSGKYDMSNFFGGYTDDNIYFNTPSQFVPNLNNHWQTRGAAAAGHHHRHGPARPQRGEQPGAERGAVEQGRAPCVSGVERLEPRLALLDEDGAPVYRRARLMQDRCTSEARVKHE